MFDYMIEKGIKPNITTYNTLLHGYATKGALSDVHGLLDLMTGNGISPNHHIFNIIIYAYGKGGMKNEAMHIFDQMRQQGSSPNAVSYGAIIDALCKLGRVEEWMLRHLYVTSKFVGAIVSPMQLLCLSQALIYLPY